METNNSTYALAFFVLFSSSLVAYQIVKKRDKKNYLKSRRLSQNISLNAYEYYPPLPDEVVAVLKNSKLCYLATCYDGSPHLSLMNFTYFQGEEVIILSTRRNTLKFQQIIENPKVAVLIHDFEVETAIGKLFEIGMFVYT